MRIEDIPAEVTMTMSAKTAEDHFITGLLFGVISGLLFGYVWKTLEFVFGG